MVKTELHTNDIPINSNPVDRSRQVKVIKSELSKHSFSFNGFVVDSVQQEGLDLTLKITFDDQRVWESPKMVTYDLNRKAFSVPKLEINPTGVKVKTMKQLKGDVEALQKHIDKWESIIDQLRSCFDK